jgi:hypothetical protein
MMALFISRAPSCQSRDLAVGSALNDFVPSLTLGYVESIKLSSLHVIKTVLIIAHVYLYHSFPFSFISVILFWYLSFYVFLFLFISLFFNVALQFRPSS